MLITLRALRVNERRGKKPQRAKVVSHSLFPSSYLKLVTTCSAERETDRDERLGISSFYSPNTYEIRILIISKQSLINKMKLRKNSYSMYKYWLHHTSEQKRVL